MVELQSHNPDYLKGWNLICDVSRREFTKIYKRLDINNLVERGESFYQKRMESLIKELSSKGRPPIYMDHASIIENGAGE